MRTTSNHLKLRASIVAIVALLDAFPAPAGTEIEAAPDKKMVVPTEKPKQTGMLTLGGEVSGDLQSGFIDGLLPLWNPGDFYFFLDTRGTYNSEDQMLGSYGLGTRYLVPGHDVILGVNGFYDSIGSMNGNDFDELGLGAEVLTHWVDARFNYYLPDNAKTEVTRRHDRSSETEFGPVFKNALSPRVLLLQQQRFDRTHSGTTRTLEAALEGWNAEVGFLVPGLDKYLELRAFVGAYRYDNPFGKDFAGVKARIEARPLPGVIANVEYWDDAYLMGGHWTGELAVSVPFSIFNLASGRNPFEGFTDSFRPRQRQFNERLSDMVIRSHRVMTVTGTQTSNSNSSNTATATEGEILLKPVVKKPAGGTPPPQVGQGEGG
jgi:hypothetical protein